MRRTGWRSFAPFLASMSKARNTVVRITGRSGAGIDNALAKTNARHSDPPRSKLSAHAHQYRPRRRLNLAQPRLARGHEVPAAPRSVVRDQPAQVARRRAAPDQAVPADPPGLLDPVRAARRSDHLDLPTRTDDLPTRTKVCSRSTNSREA
jgi:hypothetical protein